MKDLDGKYCTECNGSGADSKRTEEARKKGQIDKGSYISCWNCHGNGLNPLNNMRWTEPAPRSTS